MGKGRSSVSRRTFVFGVGGAVAMFGLGTLKLVEVEAIIRPPGGQDEDHLIGACIRCQKCYEVCPQNVIVPAYIEAGILGMRVPTLDFSSSYCDYCSEENGSEPLCVKCCPTNALVLPQDITAETTIIGKASITKNWCLAYQLTGCRFCYEACPYEAIALDESGQPHIIVEKCNGCGACESVCVSLKNASIATGATARAITVHPNKE